MGFIDDVMNEIKPKQKRKPRKTVEETKVPETDVVEMDMPLEEDIKESAEAIEAIQVSETMDDCKDGYIIVEIVDYENGVDCNGIMFMFDGMRIGISVDQKIKGIDRHLPGKKVKIPFNGKWGMIDEMEILG